MKTALHLLAAMMLLLAASCQNGTPQETNNPQETGTPQESTLIIEEKDGVTLLCHGDKPLVFGWVDLENEMSADLFRGSYNDSLLAALMPTGASRSAINAYMAIDSVHKVLFDAGLGADRGGKLLENMKKAEVDPSEITAVCLTHLHGDHIGGLLLDGRAAFPNATLYLSQEEYDAWKDGGPLAANNALWKQVMAAYQGHIVTFHDGETLFDGMVVAKLAPGHTLGHTVYEVGGICLIAGDLLHAQDLQLEHPQFCARYDADPEQATAMRIRIFNELRDNGHYLAGAHCYKHFINLKDLSKGIRE
ncbi:MAG: MBL fold metallo-hydrolase [Bacteroidales bacterium]|nr:MBL fold metallo-hydrolase [Bacteroidales bacterium]